MSHTPVCANRNVFSPVYKGDKIFDVEAEGSFFDFGNNARAFLPMNLPFWSV